MECFTGASAGDSTLDFQSAVQAEADARLRPGDRVRLSIFLRTEYLVA
jgi:hypothetical protein